MDTSIFDAIAGSGWPLISSPAPPPVTFENPSTLQFALIGIATVAAYWAIRRLLLLGQQPLAAAPATSSDPPEQRVREAA